MRKHKTWEKDEIPAPLSHKAMWDYLIASNYYKSLSGMGGVWGYVRKHIEDSTELDNVFKATVVSLGSILGVL